MDLTSLYREEILDHYQNPRNFGKIADADAYVRQTNPLCGDDIEISLRLRLGQGGKGFVDDIKFQGKGCAICLAAASMLTEHAIGKSKNELTKFSESDMLDLLVVEVSETRKKCAMLSLAVLKDCLNSV